MLLSIKIFPFLGLNVMLVIQKVFECVFLWLKQKDNNMKIMVSGALLTPHSNLVTMATKINRRHT